jgi:hypothetical protein
MLGNGIYVSTPCKSWSYSGLLELIKQVLKKFTLKNMTYGRTWHWIRIITSPPCQLAFSGGKSSHDNINTVIRILFETLWQPLQDRVVLSDRLRELLISPSTMIRTTPTMIRTREINATKCWVSSFRGRLASSAVSFNTSLTASASNRIVFDEIFRWGDQSRSSSLIVPRQTEFNKAMGSNQQLK